jgi:hypothetical protein
MMTFAFFRVSQGGGNFLLARFAILRHLPDPPRTARRGAYEPLKSRDNSDSDSDEMVR